MNNTKIPATILGVPTNLGANNMGVEMGPNAYRYQDVVPKLERAGFAVHDAGNVTVPERSAANKGANPKLPYAPEIIRISTDTATLVQQAIDAGSKPIVLGGDHSIALGAVSGASVAVDGDIGLIYFDAHGDMHTDQTSASHNIHGMQLASLMGFGAQELAGVYKETVKVSKHNVLHIGGSDFDQAELDLIAREKIQAYTMQDILTQNFGPLLPMINALQSRVKYIWISLDLDAIDAQYAPAAGMPNQKGLLYREIKMLAEYIGKHCTVLGVDVVEYNPLEDIDRKTAGLATELIANFLGKDYSWYAEYMARQ
ncbi:MAG TPA: arginase [Candidatus Saccharimonadales bacterium]|nr:arginase [Candidatus Saccharimonadales bacterium]